MRGYGSSLHHPPGPRAVTVRFVVQSTYRAQIDNIGRQLMVDALLDVSANLHVFATLGCAELLLSRDLFAETNTASAMYAAGHIGRDKRTYVFVFYNAFAVVIP